MKNFLAMFAAAVWTMAAATALRAQGFFQQYPQFPTNFWTEIQTVFPQGDTGFVLTEIQYPDFGLTTTFNWHEVDAGGNYEGIWHSQTTNIIQGGTGWGNTFWLFKEGGFAAAIPQFDASGQPEDTLLVQRFAPNGNLLWEQNLVYVSNSFYKMSIEEGPDGNLFVTGYASRPDLPTGSRGLAFKLDAVTGNLLWQNEFEGTPNGAVEMPVYLSVDGGCLSATRLHASPFRLNVQRIESNGALGWTYQPPLPSGFNSEIFRRRGMVAENADGEALVAKYLFDFNSNDFYHKFYGTDASGAQTWEFDTKSQLGNQFLSEIIVPTSDLGYVILGIKDFKKVTALKIAQNGQKAWQMDYSFLVPDNDTIALVMGRELADSSLVFYGYADQKPFLLKTGANGAAYPNSVTGNISHDANDDCQPGALDVPLEGRVVVASKTGEPSRYGSTDALGNFEIDNLDAGDYTLSVSLPNYLWENCGAAPVINIPASGGPFTEHINLFQRTIADCPVMTVDLAAPFFRRCLPGFLDLHYCNDGTSPASPASIHFWHDPLLEIDSASINYALLGDTLVFDLGTVEAGDCGNIRVWFTTSCDADLGQTLCTGAAVFPDTICGPTPDWSGANVAIEAMCDGDSVRFSIRNTGLAPTQTLDFFVVDDHVITREGTFQLAVGATHNESLPADGSTWRLSAEQEPNHPFGTEMPSLAIEACTSGTFTTGMVNMFSNRTGDPFEDVFCSPVIGAYDPNDKQAFPIGVDNEHFIEPNTTIEYLIRFQNTGTDTAFTVVLRDQLDPALDPITLRPGASSHPYTWSLSNEGLLLFRFDDPDFAGLPDSNVNEPASHGFVQFRVAQRPDLPIGTRIENRADIYFDFNDPVLTNTVWHTIGKDFLPTSGLENPGGSKPSELSLWPVPARDVVYISLKNSGLDTKHLLLRDALGRLVRDQHVTGEMIALPRSGLQDGIYFVEILSGEGLRGFGKIVWRAD